MQLLSMSREVFMEPNIIIANLVTTPIIFLGMYINLLLFKSLLNLEVSKKQTYQYIIFVGLWTCFCNTFIDNPLGLIINCLILPRYCHVNF